MGKTLLLLGLWSSLCLTTLSTTAAGLPRPALDFPLPVDSYHDQQVPSLFEKLTVRVAEIATTRRGRVTGAQAAPSQPSSQPARRGDCRTPPPASTYRRSRSIAASSPSTAIA